MPMISRRTPLPPATFRTPQTGFGAFPWRRGQMVRDGSPNPSQRTRGYGTGRYAIHRGNTVAGNASHPHQARARDARGFAPVG